jgi:DNA/RNA endonuclease YhcR with UshA esterase domain
MKTLLRLSVLAFLLMLWLPSLSQADPQIISGPEAIQHVGENVTVEDVVTVVSTSKKGNTFINFGGVYPNQTFTGWIPAGTPLASDSSLLSLEGKKIKIVGRIELYRGKPEIRILSRSQITEE